MKRGGLITAAVAVLTGAFVMMTPSTAGATPQDDYYAQALIARCAQAPTRTVHVIYPENVTTSGTSVTLDLKYRARRCPASSQWGVYADLNSMTGGVSNVGFGPGQSVSGGSFSNIVQHGPYTLTGLSYGNNTISYSYTAYSQNGGCGTCVGVGNGSFTINVPRPPTPTCTLTANPATINSGGSSTLSWTVSGTTTSRSINHGVGNVAGSSTPVSPTATITYTMTVTNANASPQSGTCTATVTVRPPTPTCTLTANPTTIDIGSSSTLRWTVSGTTTSRSINHGVGTVTGSSTTVRPTTTTTYTMTVTNANASPQSGTCTATVTVDQCLNIAEAQPSIPTGYTRNTSYHCLLPAPTCTASGVTVYRGSNFTMSVTYTNRASIAVTVVSVGYRTAISGTVGSPANLAASGTNARRTYTTGTHNQTTVGNSTITWTMTYETLYGDQTATCTANLAVRYRPPTPSCTVRSRNAAIETTAVDDVLVAGRYNGTNTAPNGRITAASTTVEGATYSSPSPAIPSTGTAVGWDAVAEYTFANVSFPNSGASIALAASIEVQTQDGIGGTYTETTTCTSSVPVGEMPYLKEFGGHVAAGGVFQTSPSACATSPSTGGIYTYNRGVGGQFMGSSAQFTVTALLGIDGFASAGQRSNAINTIPAKGLTFANTGAEPFGGNFGSGQCITDYFNATRDVSLAPSDQRFPPASIPAPARPPQIGTVSAADSNGATFMVEAGRRYEITVTGQWTNRGGTPFQVDARCQNSGGNWHMANELNTPYNHDLQVNGAFVAWRPVGESGLCSTTHQYRYTTPIVPATGTQTLRVFDGDSNTGVIEPSWYTDNSGSLQFSVTCLGCPSPPPTPGAFPSGRSQYSLAPGDASIPGLTIPTGSQIAVYVAGNAYITGNIEMADSATTADRLPNFALVVCGSIYIDHDVTRMDGLYVAQPGTYNAATERCDPPTDPATSTSGTIYTCATAANTRCAPARLTTNAAKQLSVNGSLVANRIKWLRAYSSLRNATAGEAPNFGTGAGTNAAEVVNYTPQMWIAPSPLRRPDEAPGGPSPYGPYDYIRTLPPVYSSQSSSGQTVPGYDLSEWEICPWSDGKCYSQDELHVTDRATCEMMAAQWVVGPWGMGCYFPE